MVRYTEDEERPRKSKQQECMNTVLRFQIRLKKEEKPIGNIDIDLSLTTNSSLGRRGFKIQMTESPKTETTVTEAKRWSQNAPLSQVTPDNA